jgi:hypothetical protein
MRKDLIGPKSTLTMFGAVLAGLLLGVAHPAAAWDDWYGGSGSGYGGSYGWYDAQEDREVAQEAAREAGREKRREEVQQQKAKNMAEHEAYFDSVVANSQASMQAPRDVYYRKPGYVSGEAPGSAAQVVEISGVQVFVDQGIFWVKQGQQYVVVAAPVGVVVDTIPPATTRVATKAGEYGYFFGTFYQRSGEKFVVVKPPAGLNVTYLPDGYQQEDTADGGKIYRFGKIAFKPVMAMGVLVYQVVEA